MKLKILYVLLFILSFMSCTDNSTVKDTDHETDELKTILIHCGVTMVKPMTEIAEIIEKQEDCKILITKGGSGNLYRSITSNKIGDLYLPGSEKYITIGMQSGYITDTVFVGENRAVVMVQKGNPKNIKPDLTCFKDTNLRVVIGNPHSGSIGEENEFILDKLGVYDEIKKRAEYTVVSSKDLVKALENNEADIVINWYAVSVWGNNKNIIEVLQIEDNDIIRRKKLYLGLLKFSQHPDIAEKVMNYAASEEGRAIFKKYGLYE